MALRSRNKNEETFTSITESQLEYLEKTEVEKVIKEQLENEKVQATTLPFIFRQILGKFEGARTTLKKDFIKERDRIDHEYVDLYAEVRTAIVGYKQIVKECINAEVELAQSSVRVSGNNYHYTDAKDNTIDEQLQEYEKRFKELPSNLSKQWRGRK